MARHPLFDEGQPGALASSRADVVPVIVRSLLSLIEDRGLSPDRLCMGLGFNYADLLHGRVALSMAQIRKVVARARQQLPEPGLAVQCGARQTPASWGVLGLAFYTCETFGEVIEFAIQRQGDLGAIVDHTVESTGLELHLYGHARPSSPVLETFAIEEDFASIVAVSRALLGDTFRPLRVEFAFPCGAPSPIYSRHFRCPVRFSSDANRLTLDAHWLGARLPGFDRITSAQLRAQLETIVALPTARDDLVETLSAAARRDGERLLQGAAASSINVSDRTLRRRLGRLSTTFRALSDTARFSKAKELLARPGLTVADVAVAIGYSDARAFRRAFKRWSGSLPADFRSGLGAEQG